MEGGNVAIYLDFENLAISADTVYPSHTAPLAIEPIVDFALSKGAIRIKRAYADWSRDLFAQYQPKLMEKGFELIHLPATNLQGKNGSDVRLAIDVMEMLEQFSDIDHVIIGSGDTDFIPLIQRLRSRGKTVLVLGFEHSVGNLVKLNSAAFKSLEDLLGMPREDTRKAERVIDPENLEIGRQVLTDFIKNRTDTGPILMARLKQQLMRLQPNFSEKALGFASFKSFIEAMEGDLVERIEMEQDTLPLVHLQEDDSEEATPASNYRELAERFLNKKLRYIAESKRRYEMSLGLLALYNDHVAISMNEMFDLLYDHLEQQQAKTDIKKYINTLFTGGAFEPREPNLNGPLLARPFKLKAAYQDPESIDQVYIQRVSEILQSRYPDLPAFEILDLLV
ncbi:MAG: NYN domain-containing protein [Bacteroidota bacterium]